MVDIGRNKDDREEKLTVGKEVMMQEKLKKEVERRENK